MAERHMKQITASGPPLTAVVKALKALRDKRMAAPRSDIKTRHADISKLREISSKL